jgi:hypothetical protein
MEECLSYYISSERVMQSNKMAILRKLVYHNQDVVSRSRSWETFYEVHGNDLPNPIRHK